MAKKGRWIKERKRPRPYPKTEQQKKIAEIGRKIKELCTGLKGGEFRSCRRKILEEHFGKRN